MKQQMFNERLKVKTTLLVCVLFALLPMYRLSAQNNSPSFQCGTQDLPLGKFQELRDNHIIKNKLVTPDEIPVIPVWNYIIRSSDGQSMTTAEEAENALNAINQYFTGVFSFVVCGTTIIDDDEYYNLSGGAEFISLCNVVNSLNQPLDDNCVKSFFVNTIGTAGGYAYAPGIEGPDFEHSGIVISYVTPQIVAHEMGHYFGLNHTFVGSFQDQYVSSDPAVCYTTGDGFCDTAADPGTDATLCIASSGNCAVTCFPGLTDPLGVPYSPDPTLLMSYYSEQCTNRFSGEQKAHMRAVYYGYPDYTALHFPSSECVPPPSIPLAGQVHSCSADPNFPNQPLEGLPLKVKRLQGTCDVNTDIAGKYPTPFAPTYPCNAPNPAKYTVIPQKNFENPSDPNYLAIGNGVDVYDLVLISQHILDLAPISSPYQLIAADANNSGTISSFDIVLLRQIILGQMQGLPAGSWRYVPDFWHTYSPISFAIGFNDDNPFDATTMDAFGDTRVYKSTTNDQVNGDSWMDHLSIHTANGSALYPDAWSFSAIKVGDINCNFIPDPLEDNDEELFSFHPNTDFEASIASGDSKYVSIVASSSKEVVAWQFGMSYPLNKVGLQQVVSSNENLLLTPGHFNTEEIIDQNRGVLKSIFYSEDGTSIPLDNTRLFSIQITANSLIDKIGEVLQLAPSALNVIFYDKDGNEVTDVKLELKIELSGTGLESMEERSFAINQNISFDAMFSPVPFEDELAVAINVPEAVEGEIVLFDVTGREVYKKNTALLPGLNTVEIPIANKIRGGVYGYLIKAGQYVKSGKIVK